MKSVKKRCLSEKNKHPLQINKESYRKIVIFRDVANILLLIGSLVLSIHVLLR